MSLRRVLGWIWAIVGRVLAMIDHITVEPAFAGRIEYLNVAGDTARAERSGRKVDLAAFTAALQLKLSGFRTRPEMLSLRRGFRHRNFRSVCHSQASFRLG